MNYKDNDYELLYLVSENNEDAYEILFGKYNNLIKKIARYYYNLYKKLGISLEELEQEGRIGLYDAIKYYQNNKNVKLYTFVLVCLKNNMMNYVKKKLSNKEKIYVTAVSIDDPNVIIKDDKTPYMEIVNRELYDMMIDFKNNLDFIDSNIFEMKYNDYSYDEISKLLEINKKQVDNKILKIKNKLKKYMLEQKFVL